MQYRGILNLWLVDQLNPNHRAPPSPRGPHLSRVDQLISQALSDGLDVPESCLSRSRAQQPDGLRRNTGEAGTFTLSGVPTEHNWSSRITTTMITEECRILMEHEQRSRIRMKIIHRTCWMCLSWWLAGPRERLQPMNKQRQFICEHSSTAGQRGSVQPWL